MGLLVLISVFLYFVRGFFSPAAADLGHSFAFSQDREALSFLHAVAVVFCHKPPTSSPHQWQRSWVPVVVTMLGHLWGWEGQEKHSLSSLSLGLHSMETSPSGNHGATRCHQDREKARPPREDKLLSQVLLNGKRAAMCVEVPKPRKKLEFSSSFWTSFAFLLKSPQKHVASNFSICNVERAPSKLV